MLATIWNDIRYSVRTLARNPGVTGLVIATIALGVGVNAGIFTTVNVVASALVIAAAFAAPVLTVAGSAGVKRTRMAPRLGRLRYSRAGSSLRRSQRCSD